MPTPKQTTEALRASEELFRLLIEGVKDYAIFTLDPAGKVLTWNSGAELVFGYKAAEVIGGSYAQFFRAEDVTRNQDRAHDELVRAAAAGRLNITGWRIRKDGSRFWANGILTALYHANGEVRGFAKITSDLTDQHREDTLLHAVLQHFEDSIMCIDQQGLIKTFNRAAEVSFGYTQAEVLGRNVSMLMGEPYRSEHDAHLADYDRTGVARIIGIGREVECLRKDGVLFPARLMVSTFQDDSDGGRHYVGVLHDITQQRILEAQFRQSQKMEAFGQLAAGVAHDFNNLLTVIGGYSQLLLLQCPGDDPKRDFLWQIQRAGDRSAALTRQLLAFSRQQVLDPKVLDLNRVIADTEVMLCRVLGEDVQLVTALPPGLALVKVDPGQIEQVILNLSVNARAAMPNGGRLTIETKNVSLDQLYSQSHPTTPPGPYVLLAISDTGGGMTAEVKGRVFEPFFTTKGSGKGTGLGLAVVHGIVKQSGGSIEVYSEVGVGSTFKIYLPAVRERAPTVFGAETSPVGRGTETVLLVEDDPAVRELTAIVLEEHGYTVIKTSGGADALLRMESLAGSVDLVLTDVVMPEMSGVRLVETLKARYPSLKTLFVSGYADDAVFRHGVLRARVAFLQKPFTVASLTRKVREVLDQA